MKKLMMTAAVAAMIFATANTNAQTQAERTPAQMEKSVQEGFQKIEISDIPNTVTEAVEQEFKGASIAEAYMNKKKEFKLILKTEGAEAKTIYANAEGEWIKPNSKMRKAKK